MHPRTCHGLSLPKGPRLPLHDAALTDSFGEPEQNETAQGESGLGQCDILDWAICRAEFLDQLVSNLVAQSRRIA